MRWYLEGYRFEVVTDQLSLKWLNSIGSPSGRVARWGRKQGNGISVIGAVKPKTNWTRWIKLSELIRKGTTSRVDIHFGLCRVLKPGCDLARRSSPLNFPSWKDLAFWCYRNLVGPGTPPAKSKRRRKSREAISQIKRKEIRALQ